MNVRSILAALILAAAFGMVPLASLAQTMPGPNGSMSMSDPNHVRGRVDSFDGGVNAVVHGMRVKLHKGTIIHPTGATITPGQYVIVNGHWVGHHFAADEIRIRH
jgi:hypothetical protein